MGRAIESVMEQQYTNVEHIIMDGGSTDGTEEIVRRYPLVRWYSEKDNGQADAMNKAFLMSTGEVIVYLNADDWFDTGVFHAVAEAFNSSKAEIVIGNGTFVFEGSEKHEHWQSASTYQKCLQHYRYSFPLNPFSYFYKREVQDYVGGFNLHNHYTMDFEFLLAAFQKFPALKIERNFGFYWFDGHNKTSTRNSRRDCRHTVIRHCLRNDLPMLPRYLYDFYSTRAKEKAYLWLKRYGWKA